MKVGSAPAAVTPRTTASASASVPQAPAGVAQQCVAVEGLLTNATSILTSAGAVSSAADLKKSFTAYGKQLRAAAVGGPAKLTTSVNSFVAALDTYSSDAETGTAPPANLLTNAATAVSTACTP